MQHHLARLPCMAPRAAPAEAPPFVWDPAAWADAQAQDHLSVDCILLLAGGVDETGQVHATVCVASLRAFVARCAPGDARLRPRALQRRRRSSLQVARRLDAAAELYRRSDGKLSIICNGGGA